jgi:hypothetical protein
MAAQKPACQRIFQWLRANLDKRSLGALTHTDTYALMAAVQIIELYAYAREPEVLLAFKHCVERMQPQCQEFAYHGIAMVMNWEDRAQIWHHCQLPFFTPMKCKFE